MTGKEGIENILDKFAKRATLHGAGRLSSAKYLEVKDFWSLVYICLGSLGMLSFTLTSIIFEYL